MSEDSILADVCYDVCCNCKGCLFFISCFQFAPTATLERDELVDKLAAGYILQGVLDGLKTIGVI